MSWPAASAWQEHVVRPYEHDRTLEEILTGSFGLPKHVIAALGRTRGVRLNGRPAGLTARTRHADTVAVRLGEAPSSSGLEPTAMPLAILFQDDDLLVLDKPPYVLVHPTEPGQLHTLVNGIAHLFRQQGRASTIHPVHRLDRDTSGLLVMAASPAAHRNLGAQLVDRTLKREYLALVSGRPREDSGTIDAPIGTHPTQPALRAVRADGEPATTHFAVLERYADASLVGLRLETGRTHQIRVHMHHLGHPLLGDRRYGRRGGKRIGRQALHAARLSLRHPASGEALRFEAALPADMARLRAALLDSAPGSQTRCPGG